jgi:hypothetical protein
LHRSVVVTLCKERVRVGFRQLCAGVQRPPDFSQASPFCSSAHFCSFKRVGEGANGSE